jgi:hypothetical protein
MMVSLGAVSVAVVDNPNKCPAGTYPSTIAVATGASTPRYECLSGEPWYCEWFGIGCKGVPAVTPAAPQTEQQMRDPLSWTPEDSIQATRERQQQLSSAWLQATGGIAEFQSGAYQAGEAVADAVSSPGLWFVVGAAAVVAVIVLAKRA